MFVRLIPQDPWIREVLEQRDDIRECFVEGKDIGVDGLIKPRVHAIQQRMRRLMRNNIVRQASEHDRTWRIGRILYADREVSE